MYELKKMERYLRVNLLGPGPRLIKKRIYRAAVSQRLRNTDIDAPFSFCSLFTGSFEYKDENLVHRLHKMSANVKGREIHFPFRVKYTLLQMILSLISPFVIQSRPFQQIISHVTNSCSASSIVTPCALPSRV